MNEIEPAGDPTHLVHHSLLAPDGRFVLLVVAKGGDPQRLSFPVLHRPDYLSRPMTGVNGDGEGGEEWFALHAFPVVTVYEFVGLMRLTNMRGSAATLWDLVTGSRATSDGQPWLRVEDGWREPMRGNSRTARLSADMRRLRGPLPFGAVPDVKRLMGREDDDE